MKLKIIIAIALILNIMQNIICSDCTVSISLRSNTVSFHSEMPGAPGDCNGSYGKAGNIQTQIMDGFCQIDINSNSIYVRGNHGGENHCSVIWW